MKKVLILTKTNWNEPPRIRHQITRLLKSKGFQIVYVEKNAYKNVFIMSRTEEGIDFYGHAELIHHQLRYFPVIQWANNTVVKFYLARIMKGLDFDFIFNFCYDYSFLKTIAPGKRIITMIEDDFESQAKFGMKSQIRNQVATTCRNSDEVVTVSYPLETKLKTYTKNVTLLFPWSQQKYKRPAEGTKRNTVLYFGYVYRLDWEMIEHLVRDTGHHFRFVGPTGKSKDEEMIAHLSVSYSNFEYIPYSQVSELRLDDVFCSFLPYDPGLQSVQACTISNRAFNLLSLGLPLAYADLEYLIESPATVIRKNKSFLDYCETLAFFKKNFYEIQNDIASFLNANYEEDRWKLLDRVIHGEQRAV